MDDTRVGWRILHLTDLHLHAKSDVDSDAKHPTPSHMEESASQRLLPTLRTKALGPIDAVVISGDITFQGNPDGFEKFETALFPALLELVDDKPERIFVVPGNHDVTWNVPPGAADLYTQRFGPFRAMTNRLSTSGPLFPEGSDPAPSWTGHSVYCDRKRRVIVACINSAIRCGEASGKLRATFEAHTQRIREHVESAQSSSGKSSASHRLEDALVEVRRLDEALASHTVADIAHVGPQQRQKLHDELEQLRTELGKDWPHYFRIATLHHHLLPLRRGQVEIKAFEPVVDATQVLQLLEDFQFDLALTGHKHTVYEAFSSASWPLLVAGGPTVAGTSPQGERRGFQVVRVGPKLAGRANIRIDVVDLSVPFGRAEQHVEDCLSLDTPDQSELPSGRYHTVYTDIKARDPSKRLGARLEIDVGNEGRFLGRTNTPPPTRTWTVFGHHEGEFIKGEYDELEQTGLPSTGVFFLHKRKAGVYEGWWGGHDAQTTGISSGHYIWRHQLEVEVSELQPGDQKRGSTVLDLLKRNIGSCVEPLLSRLQPKKCTLFIASISGIIVGAVVVELLGDAARKKYSAEGAKLTGTVGTLQHLAVDNGHKDRGVGSRLVMRAQQQLKDWGCDSCFAIAWRPVKTASGSSEGLLKLLGFEAICERKNYWTDDSQSDPDYCAICKPNACGCSGVFMSHSL